MGIHHGPDRPREPPYSDLPGFTPSAATSSARLRKLMIEDGFEFKCSHPSCGITHWMGKPARLQIDHIDGNRSNNLRSNLRFLCANCHTLTDTFGSGNRRRARKAAIVENAVVCYDELVRQGVNPSMTAVFTRIGFKPKYSGDRELLEGVLGDHDRELWSPGRYVPRPTTEKIRWPSDEKLAELLRTMSRVELGERLGVSDTAIKKRCKVRGILEPAVRRSRKRKTIAAPKNRSSEDRAKASRTRRLKRLATLHGTTGGYRLEVRLGLDTCTPCRAANAGYTKQLRATSPTT